MATEYKPMGINNLLLQHSPFSLYSKTSTLLLESVLTRIASISSLYTMFNIYFEKEVSNKSKELSTFIYLWCYIIHNKVIQIIAK